MNQMTNRVILIDQTYRKMWGSVLAIFRQACLCEADCEDLAQNVFLRLMSLDLLVPETIEGMTATIAYHFAPTTCVAGPPFAATSLRRSRPMHSIIAAPTSMCSSRSSMPSSRPRSTAWHLPTGRSICSATMPTRPTRK